MYDRQQHLRNLRDWLGEDLFFRKDGKTPRKCFARPEVFASINDGSHQLAHDALQAFIQFLPWSWRNGAPRWSNYGVAQPHYIDIATITRKTGYGGLSKPIWQRNLWINHMFMRQSLFPSYWNESRFDAVLMDIDIEIHGEALDLYLLNSDQLADVLSPVQDAVEAFSSAVGGLTFEWLLSGFRGVWLQLHVDDTGDRKDVRRIRDAIVNCMPGNLKVVENKPVMQAYGVAYTFDDGNLGKLGCRVPWSMHTVTDNVAVNFDPLTGEVDPLRFVQYYSNPTSLHEIAANIPLKMCQRPAVFYPRFGDPVEGLFGEQPDVSVSEATAGVQPSTGISHADLSSQIIQPGDVDRFLDWDEVVIEKPPSRRFWSWEDVIAEAENPERYETWRDLVCRDAPEGSKRNVIVMGGNLMKVAAAMKGQYGRIDWDEIIHEYEAAYKGADFRKGGTIRTWVNQLRTDTKQGKKITPHRSTLSPFMVQRCSEYADSTVAALTANRKPSTDSLYHVLLCLCRLCVNRDEFEVSEDYLSRRAGINPYATWEEQVAAESSIVSPAHSPNHKRRGSDCMNRSTGGDDTAVPTSEALHPERDLSQMEDIPAGHARDYPTSANARKRLSALLRCVCDMDGNETGSKPFVRLAVGSNRRDHERVLEKKRPVGSLFRKVATHPFWERMADGTH